MSDNLAELTKEAIKIFNVIKVTTEAMKPFSEKLEAIKIKIDREMRMQGVKELSIPEGKSVWVELTRKQLNKIAIADKLGLEDLSEFETLKKSSYIKITSKKEDKI